MKLSTAALVVIITFAVVFSLSTAEPIRKGRLETPEPGEANGIFLKSRVIMPEQKGPSAFYERGFRSGVKAHMIVQFASIPGRGERERLRSEGVELLDYIPENAWIVSTSRSKYEIRGMDAVTFVGYLLPDDKIEPGLKTMADGGVNGEIDVSVRFFKDIQTGEAGEILKKYGEVKGFSEYGNYWTLRIPAGSLRKLAGEDGVKWISSAGRKLRTFNNGSRVAAGVDAVQSVYGLKGTGVVVAEWDDGWAEWNHSDLIGRVSIGDNGTCSYPETCANDDHATHVGGTVMGSGNKSSGTYRGMAPNATLVSYEWPNTITEIYTESNDSVANYNAVISQNSWGYDTSPPTYCSIMGDYDELSYAYDNIVNGNSSVIDSPIVVVFAAGNERAPTRCGGYGYVYNTTVGPGGTAKNVITVGAVNSNDDSMTSFSSWGPTDDGRIKPDVVAPGCEDEPNRNDSNPDKTIWSTETGDSYGGMCGTSQAAPVVSGISALVFEDYRDKHNDADPLPSTVKAVLLHTATDLNNTGPDYSTGWGLVNATAAVNKVREDVNGTETIVEGNLSTTGENRTYKIYVSNQADLKLTLVWDDYPADLSSARQLVNDLDLIVTNSSGDRFYPWTLDKDNPGAAAVRSQKDNINNVEQVYVSNPSAGIWTVVVNATSLPEPIETFSLVSSNDLADLPNVTLIEPEDGYETNVTALNFTCSATDNTGLKNITFFTNTSGVWQSVGTKNITGTSNSSTWNLSGITDGGYIWNCLVYDGDGSPDWAESNYTFSVDTPPAVEVVEPENRTNSTNQTVTFSFNVSDNRDSFLNCSIYINGVLNQTNSSAGNASTGSFELNLSEGDFAWYIVCRDSFNSTNQSAVRIISIDRTPPAITIISPLNRSYNNQTVLINISYSDTHIGDVWFFNGTENISYSSPVYQNFSEENHQITVYANDTFGNTNHTSLVFTVDLTPPSLTIVSPENNIYYKTRLNLTFLAGEELDTCWYGYNGTNTTITGCTNTTFIPLDDQTSALILYANDTAGNMNQTAAEFSVYTPDINYSVAVGSSSSAYLAVETNISNINMSSLRLSIQSPGDGFVSNFTAKNVSGGLLGVTGNSTDKDINTTGLSQIRVRYNVTVYHTNQTTGGYNADNTTIDVDYGMLIGKTVFFTSSNSSVDISAINVKFELPSGWSVAAPWERTGEYYNVSTNKALKSIVGFGNLTLFNSTANGTVIIWAYPANASRPYQNSRFYYVSTAGERPTFDGISYTPAYYSLCAGVFNESLGGYSAVLFPLFADGENGTYTGGYSAAVSPYSIHHSLSKGLFQLWSKESVVAESGEEKWFEEGVSEYYSCVLRYRAGYLTKRQYYNCLKSWYDSYTAVIASNSSYNISLTEAGQRAEQGEVGFLTVVRGRGAAVAYMLSKNISAGAQNKTMDDVMSAMYTDFGKTGVKYRNADIVGRLNSVSGINFTVFFDSYINGTAELEEAADDFSDSDSDGLLKVYEEEIGTDPGVFDTDGDGMGDGDEVDAGRNPLVSDLVATTGTSGGGGGPIAGKNQTKVTKYWSVVKPGEAVVFSISKTSISFTAVEIVVTSELKGVELTVKPLGKKPETAGEPDGKVYQYIEMEKKNIDDTDIESASITFTVNRSWILKNKIDRNSVALNRYMGKWEKLPTALVSEDDEFVYFKAVTAGFSYFAITGETEKAGICRENESRCSEAALERCNGSEWERVKVCENGCVNGSCVEIERICELGSRVCEGDRIVVCSQDGTEWVRLESCEWGCSEGKCVAEREVSWNWYVIAALLFVALAAAVALVLKRRPPKRIY
jgi:PGF-pre-PGF domain-containing protein